PRRDVHRPNCPASTPAPSEGSAGRFESTVAGNRHGHQGQHAVASAIAGSFRICQSAHGFLPTAPHPRWRTPTDNSDRPGGQGGGRTGRSKLPQFRATLLPTDPRLPRAVAAKLADTQAERNSPGPGGTSAGGSSGGVECSTGEPATAVALAMV